MEVIKNSSLVPNLCMKNIFFLSLLFLLIHPSHSFSQAKEFHDTKWTSLRSALLNRANDIMTFQVALMDSKTIDKKIWAELAKDAVSLSKHLDSVPLINTASMKLTNGLNNKLTFSLGLVIMQLVTKDQPMLEKLSALTAKLEANEQRLIAEQKIYNAACTESNRPDLLFENKLPGKN